MNFFIKPYSILFSMTLISGIFISMTSSNWISLWLGLELNLYSFIPLTLMSQKNQEKEAMIKYFMAQATASMLLLMALITSKNYSYILILSLMMKLGMAPFHFWLPQVMNSIPWSACWILSTLQKVAPLILLTQMFYEPSPLLLSTIAVTSTLVGAIGGLNQTQLRAILAYSSIGHMGWMAASSIYSHLTAIFYFISYIIIISATIQPMNMTSISMMASPPTFKAPTNSIKISLILNMFSLGGLPPMFGFFPKLLVINSLSLMNFTLLQLILILASTVNLYYYLKVATVMFFHYKNLNYNPLSVKKVYFILPTLMSTFSSILLFPLIF